MPTSIKEMVFTVTVANPAPIAQAAANLAAGEQTGTSFTTSWTGSSIPIDTYWNWNNKWFIDGPNDLGYGATKLANSNGSMHHFVYDMVNNIFRSANCGFNTSGHVYDCVAYDYDDARGFLVPGGGRDDTLWYTDVVPGSTPANPTSFGDTAATAISSIMYTTGSFISAEGAMDYHPNLYGAGQGGWVIVCQKGIAARRKSTGVYSTIMGAGTFINADVPGCVYSRGLDACVVAINGPGTGTAMTYKVTNSTTITTLSAQPMSLGPDRNNTGAALVDAPNGQATVYALERVANGKVWKLSGTSWELQTYTHPFIGLGSAEDFMVAPYYDYGCFVALERVNTGNRYARLRLWRPNT